MSVKEIVLSQYKNIVNRAFERARDTTVPKEGWLRTTRKALNMSGVQVARKLGVAKSTIFNTEKAELEGAVTLKRMSQVAEGMGCRFVYFVIPDEPVDKVLSKQAKKKALDVVGKASNQMALEAQTLSDKQLKYEVERLQQQFLKEMPSDLWDS